MSVKPPNQENVSAGGAASFDLCAQCLNEYRELKFDPEAELWLSMEPFSCIVWTDEHPNCLTERLCQRHPQCLKAIMELSSARMMLWTSGEVPEHLRGLWQEAQKEIPEWPGFRRLQIGPEEREALKGIDEEIASLENFMAEHYTHVDSRKNQDGLWTFEARAGWFLRALNRLGLHGLRPWWMHLRCVSLFWVMLCCALCLLLAFTWDWLDSRQKWTGSVVSGRITDSEPGPIFLLHRRVNVRIALEGSTNFVTATIAPYLQRGLPQTVRFHYSGDPTREVFLHEIESNPRWPMLATIALIAGGFVLSYILYCPEGTHRPVARKTELPAKREAGN